MLSRESKPGALEEVELKEALSALGRSINIASTYGIEHPAFHQSISATMTAVQTLLIAKKKIILGVFNGRLSVNESPVEASGTLLKSLERHLVRLRITGLRITQGITETELVQLCQLLSQPDADEFKDKIEGSNLNHIKSESIRFEAVEEGQTVANKGDLIGSGGDGVLVLDDDLGEASAEGSSAGDSSVHVDQIVAFLQGSPDVNEDDIGKDLADLASDPARLGKMIMESVAIRQSNSDLNGESLSDVILGCLRRTFNGLRKQPQFKTPEGAADMQKALLLLEESMLDKLRDLTGESNPELDREIVQAIRSMDESLGFEVAANQYVKQSAELNSHRSKLKDYIKENGEEAAEELLSNTDFPAGDWRRIVVESQSGKAQGINPPVMAGLNTLSSVLEQIGDLMKAESTAPQPQVDLLLDQANDNLGNTASATKEKLENLSKNLLRNDEDTGTIDGQGRQMERKELLSSIAEIAQELMQPLTAINASLEMLLSGYVGEVVEEQKSLLTLASKSGDNLNYLMHELIKIVGIPINRGVDKRFAIPSDNM